MKNKHKRPQHGFGLVETLLTLGALSALSLGIYLVLAPASAAAQAKREQDNLRDLSTAVDQSFGLLGSFQGVSASRVVEDGLAPTRMVEGDTLRTSWGTSVTIAPHAVKAAADGFVVVYPFAPADVCPRLAAAVSRDAYDIRVEGVSVYDGGQLNPSAAAAACGQADTATMEFVYHSGLVAGTAVAASPLQLPPAPPSVTPPTSPPTGGPVGPADPVGPAGPVAPVLTAPPVAPPPSFLPPTPPPSSVTTTTPPSVTPPPVTPPTTVAACVVPPSWTQSESRSAACAAGQHGTVTEGRTASHTYACPEAWDAPVETVSPWSAWTVTGSTCVNCPAPSTQSETQWLATPSACAAAQYGTRSWEREQARSRSVSYNCPAGTTTLPPATIGGWSAWTDTGATRAQVNTCVNCPAPFPQTDTQWVDASATCPAGQAGTHTWEAEQTRTRTGSYNCPAGTSTLPPATFSGWSAWASTGATRNVVNTCAPSTPTCANATTAPFRLVSYNACSNDTGTTVGGSPALPNPATGDYCTGWIDFATMPGGPHGANFSGENNITIRLEWQGNIYSCYYSGYLGTSSSGQVYGSAMPALPPGISCESMNFFATSQGWGLGGALNILGPGPQYTTCP